MPLNDLTLSQLVELTANLCALERAGNDLRADGLEPTFDLTPGEQMVITVSARMPDLDAVIEDLFAPDQPATLSTEAAAAVSNWRDELDPPRNWDEGEEHQVAEIYALNRLRTPFNDPTFEAAEATGRKPDDIAAYVGAHLYSLCQQHLERLMSETPFAEAAPVQGGGEPVDAPPVDEGPAGGAPMPSASASSAADMPETIPPAASIPQEAPQPAVAETEDSGGGHRNGSGAMHPAATHERTFSGAAPWTDEEDARLINLVCTGVHMFNMSKSAAIRSAAAELGRSESATSFRCYHQLRARLTAEMAAAQEARDIVDPPGENPATQIPSPEAARQDAPPPQAEVQGEGAVPQVRDAPALEPEAGAGATSTSIIADPVTAYLMALPNKDGWTLARDLDLIELTLAGWMPNEIALELKVRADQVKARFDLLTGLHTDEATGKQARRWPREAVFDALQALRQADARAAGG